MPLVPVFSTQFKRDLARIEKQGKDTGKIKMIIALLMEGVQLPQKNKDHALTGNWKHHRECHVEPDWLMIYKLSEDEVYMARTGSHAELFGK